MPAPVKVISDYFLLPSFSTGDRDASVRAMPNGRLGLAWLSQSDIGFAGAVAGAVAFGQINVTPAFTDLQVTQAFTPSGFRIITWTRQDNATSDQDIRAEIYVPGSNQTIVPNFLVNVGATTGRQYQPQAIAIDEDSFLIAWIDENTSRVRATIIEVGGEVLDAPFDVSTGAVSQDFELGLARVVSTAGVIHIVATYRLDPADAAFRIIDQQGQMTAQFDYDSFLPGPTSATATVALADGRFAIIADDGNGNGLISGRIFNLNGSLSVGEFNILAEGEQPRAVALEDGRFFVINTAGGEIRGQVMKADGTKDGGVVAINAVTAGTQSNADMTVLADGRIAIIWQTGEAGDQDIKATILDPRETGIELLGTPLADNYVGSAFDDIILTGDGNDVVDGGDGFDTLAGGSGDDTLNGGNGADSLRGGNGRDIIDGNAGGDWMYGNIGNDVFVVRDAGDRVFENAGEGSDEVLSTISWVLTPGSYVETMLISDPNSTDALDLIGNALGQTIFGNAGANILDGAGGGDVLVGRGGDDLYGVKSGIDQVHESAGAGNDRVFAYVSWTLTAGSAVETLSTYNASTTDGMDLKGNTLNQFILGNEGANRLDGGGGTDTLEGRGGADVFTFTSALGGPNITTITDFVIGTDKLGFGGISQAQLAAGAFRFGGNAQDADDRIMYDPATGFLYYDGDGNGAGARLQFGAIQSGLNLSASDFVTI